MILWFWLAVLLATSMYSFFYWLSTSLTHSTGRSLVQSYIHKVCLPLCLANLQIDPSVARSMERRALVDEFVSTKLRADGLFLIRLVAANSGDLVTCELLNALWRQFLTERRAVPPPYSEPLLLSKKDIDEAEL